MIKKEEKKKKGGGGGVCVCVFERVRERVLMHCQARRS